MGRIVGLVLAWTGVWLTVPLQADDQDAARALIERAIKAHGGEDGLAKFQTSRRAGTGTMVLSGKELPFTEETVVQLPERARIAVDVDRKVQIITVVNGDKGWNSAGGAVMELSKERVEEIREESYVLWLATLVPLKKSSFKLTPLTEVKVNGKPVVGVQASAKDHGDVNLFFDKENGLLVKIERKAREAGVPVEKEYFYSEHKEFAGVKLPTKLVLLINGKKVIESSSLTYKVLDKVSEGTFAKP
jgi:hypothetical protein